MKINVQNLGAIKNSSIELGNLTIVCGKNNTGKTYLSYAVHELLRRLSLGGFNRQFGEIDFEKIEKDLKKSGQSAINIKELMEELKQITQGRKLDSATLKDIFKIEEEAFKSTEVSLSETNFDLFDNSILFTSVHNNAHKFETYTKGNILYIEYDNFGNTSNSDINFKREIESNIRSCVASLFFPFPTFLTVHREAIEMFDRLISLNRNMLFDKILQTKNSLEQDRLTNILTLGFVVQQNILFKKHIDFSESSYLHKEFPEISAEIEELLGIKYIRSNDEELIQDAKTGSVFRPHTASTSIRSLYAIHLWIKHFAKKGYILMIDEPELGLHPENQIKIARLFAKLVNAGIKIWIATQSDYIVKEINNLILLSNDFPDKQGLLERQNYTKNDILNPNDVKIYVTENNGISEIGVTNKGMAKTEFDEAIYKINEVSDEVTYYLSL